MFDLLNRTKPEAAVVEVVPATGRVLAMSGAGRCGRRAMLCR
jgi:hypothetical protein